MMAGSGSGEGSLPGSPMATFSLCPYVVERSSDCSSFYCKGANPIMETLNLIINQRLGVRFST